MSENEDNACKLKKDFEEEHTILNLELNEYKKNKDQKHVLDIFQVDLDNLFEILISIKLLHR